MSSGLLSGIPKNYHDTYVSVIPKSTEGLHQGCVQGVSRLQTRQGFSSILYYLGLQIKHEVGETRQILSTIKTTHLF